MSELATHQNRDTALLIQALKLHRKNNRPHEKIIDVLRELTNAIGCPKVHEIVEDIIRHYGAEIAEHEGTIEAKGYHDGWTDKEDEDFFSDGDGDFDDDDWDEEDDE